jgi:hypothetical protein
MRHELTGFTFAGLPDGQISELAVQVNWLSSPIRKNFPLCQGPNHVDIPRRPDPPGQSGGAWRVPRIRMRRARAGVVAIFYSSDGFVFGRIDPTLLPSEREVRPIRACAVLGLMVGSDWHQPDAVTILKREGRAPQHT